MAPLPTRIPCLTDTAAVLSVILNMSVLYSVIFIIQVLHYIDNNISDITKYLQGVALIYYLPGETMSTLLFRTRIEIKRPRFFKIYCFSLVTLTM